LTLNDRKTTPPIQYVTPGENQVFASFFIFLLA
jgi:hypothetical protein